MNKHSELEIFKLCERLAELLGDEEAIADLKYLYNRHPEMFTDMQDISNTINNIVSFFIFIRCFIQTNPVLG